MMKMKLVIETEIDPQGDSATFDLIADDATLRSLAGAESALEGVAETVMTQLRAVATDIVVHGRSVEGCEFCGR
jgi:hypothetical protein